MGLHLVIGNKNYSSWSMRPWIGMRATGIAFDETLISLDAPDFKPRLAKLSGTGTAPVAATAGGTPINGSAASSSSAPTGSSGGCQMAAPGAANGGIPFLALLGLTALSRRRRSS